MFGARSVVLSAILVAGAVILASCANRGEPFVPARPGVIDSTKVQGAVYGHWTKAKSPYYVVDDAVVPKNRMLVIDPGVYVIFVDKGLSMKIQGTLIAEGTSDSLITFRPTVATAIPTYPGDWGSLIFQSSPGNRLAWVRVQYATNGIIATDSDITLRNSFVRDTQFDAIQLTRTALDMVDCTIASNGGNGLTLDACENPPYAVRIIHCNIGLNRFTGVRCVNSTIYAERSDIKNNGFKDDPDNEDLAGGLHFEGAPGLNLPMLRRCNVELNEPCDVRNLMSSGLFVDADSLYWGIVTTGQMDALSNQQDPTTPQPDNCLFDVPAFIDGWDVANAGYVSFCFWRGNAWPNFSSSKGDPLLGAR